MTTTPLNFNALREANLKRLPLFKNSRGGPAHSEPDGSDWCLAQWSNATLGELGEAPNIIKKIDRGGLTLGEARPLLAKELADTQTYLDILAYRAGIDLGAATIDKWNEVSERIGVTLRLTPHGPVDILNSIVKWAVKVFCNRSSRVLIAGVEAPPCVAYDVPVLFAMNPTLADMRQMSLVLHVEGYSITVHKNRHGAQGQTYKVSFGEFVTISETLETIAVVNDA